MSGRVFGRIVSYVVLVLIGIVGIAPFVYLLILSFKSRIDVLTVPPDLHFDWAHDQGELPHRHPRRSTTSRSSSTRSW